MLLTRQALMFYSGADTMLKVTASVAAAYGQPGMILGFSFNLTLKSIDLSICFHL